MIRLERKMRIASLLCVVGLGLASVNAEAQYGGGGTGGGGTAAAGSMLNRNYHLGFDRPEAWALKHFTSASLLSGLPAPDPPEGRRVGAISLGLELGWLPTRDAGQRQVGFNGRAPQDINKTPVFFRPVLRVGLPAGFTAVIAAPPPFHMLGVTTHLLAFGLERPLVGRER